MYLIFLLFSANICLVITSEFCEKSSQQVHYRLKQYLLCDYDAFTRPKIDHRNATTVQVLLGVDDFSYDIHSSIMSVNAYIVFYWMDDHLKWNPVEYEGLTYITLRANEIWTPDISIYNRHEQANSGEIIDGTTCSVNFTGGIETLVPVKIDVKCSSDLVHYPFDNHHCTITLGSWAHSTDAVTLERCKEGAELENSAFQDEWNVKRGYYGSHDITLAESNLTKMSLWYTFIITRRGDFHVATVVVPCIGLLEMTLLVLLMDIREIERLALMICNILSHITYIQYISWQLPSGYYGGGDSLPKIVLFGRNSFIIALVELTLQIFLRKLMKSSVEASTGTANWISKTVVSRLGHMILEFDFGLKSVVNVHKLEDQENIVETNAECAVRKDCYLFAKLIDRICVLVFSICYFVMFIDFILML